MNNKTLVIGTRGSKLALIYANKAKLEISKYYKNDIIIKPITTKGDQEKNKRISEIGGKGLFSKNIENQLLEKKIDIAVHALKDMPSDETNGLITCCFLKRNYINEVLISKNHIKFAELKKNSVIGTSSFRREFQLKKKRGDLKFKLIRGNIDTRIQKVKDGTYDAILLAKAGVELLNLKKEVSEEFTSDEIIPSAGQGIIAIQCRKDDSKIQKLLKKINHEKTEIAAIAERQVLKSLEGDCDTAVGVLSKINSNKIHITAELFSIDGKDRYFVKSSNKITNAKILGNQIGEILKKKSNNSYKN